MQSTNHPHFHGDSDNDAWPPLVLRLSKNKDIFHPPLSTHTHTGRTHTHTHTLIKDRGFPLKGLTLTLRSSLKRSAAVEKWGTAFLQCGHPGETKAHALISCFFSPPNPPPGLSQCQIAGICCFFTAVRHNPYHHSPSVTYNILTSGQ